MKKPVNEKKCWNCGSYGFDFDENQHTAAYCHHYEKYFPEGELPPGERTCRHWTETRPAFTISPESDNIPFQEATMKIMIIVDECFQCPHIFRLKPDSKSVCDLKEKAIPDPYTIPSWCPLPDATEKEVS